MEFWFWRLRKGGTTTTTIGNKSIPVEILFTIKKREVIFYFNPHAGIVYKRCCGASTLDYIKDSFEKEAKIIYKKIFPKQSRKIIVVEKIVGDKIALSAIESN